MTYRKEKIMCKKSFFVISLAILFLFSSCAKPEVKTFSESKFFDDTYISFEEYEEKYESKDDTGEYFLRTTHNAYVSFDKETDTAELDTYWRTASKDDNLTLNIECEGLTPDKTLYVFIDGNIDSPVVEENSSLGFEDKVALKGSFAEVGTHKIQFVQFKDNSWEPSYCVSSEYYIED